MKLWARVTLWMTIGVVAWLIIGTFNIVKADEMDTFNNMPIKERCDWKVKTFLSAVDSREQEHARKIIHADRELMKQWIASGKVKQDQFGRVTMPKDGMYVFNFGNISPRSQQFIEKIIYYGWDMADAWIRASIAEQEQLHPHFKGKLNAIIAPETRLQWAQKYYADCLRDAGAEKRVQYSPSFTNYEHHYFLKVQSEEIQTTPKYKSYGMWSRIEGCMQNRGHYFQNCLDENQGNARSQNDIIHMLQYCDDVVLEKFFDCTELYPNGTK